MSSWTPPTVKSRIPAGEPAAVDEKRATRLRQVDEFRTAWLIEHPDANADDLEVNPDYAAGVRRLLASD